jgi:cupin superfamily acireductone dioxygenase involved in methionine salvage
MRAYYFDNVPGDQRLPHDSGKPVDLEHLRSLQVRYWTVPQEPGYEVAIDNIAKEEGYKNRDTINVTKEGLGDLYETKLKAFFDECVVIIQAYDAYYSSLRCPPQTHARRRRDTVYPLWIWLL